MVVRLATGKSAHSWLPDFRAMRKFYNDKTYIHGKVGFLDFHLL